MTASGTGGDYDKVVKTLRKCYDCPRPIYKMHLQQLMQCRVCYSRDEMHKTMDLWNKHVMGLRQYGPFEAGHLLTAIAEMTMDEETFREWSIFTAREEMTPTYEKFIEFLEERASALPPKAKSKPIQPVKNVTKVAAYHSRDQCCLRSCNSPSVSVLYFQKVPGRQASVYRRDTQSLPQLPGNGSLCPVLSQSEVLQKMWEEASHIVASN